MGQRKIKEVLYDQNLSFDDRFKIDGPWGHKGLSDFRTPLYIFVPGGEKVEIGEVVAKIGEGLMFEIELKEEYKDADQGAFEVPMRFHVRIDKEKNDPQ